MVVKKVFSYIHAKCLEIACFKRYGNKTMTEKIISSLNHKNYAQFAFFIKCTNEMKKGRNIYMYIISLIFYLSLKVNRTSIIFNF